MDIDSRYPIGHRPPPRGSGERAGLTLIRVSGYRRSHGGRNNAPFIRSITHAPDQTYIRLQHLHCLFDLAISPPFWIIAWIETIFMEFRGPKALVNLHDGPVVKQLLEWIAELENRRPHKK